MSKKITADTLIADCLQLNPNAPEILMAAGMHCFGCALAHGETVAEPLIFSLGTGGEKCFPFWAGRRFVT